MNVKQAVEIAKTYVADLFAGEGAENIGLEEVEFAEPAQEWLVTIGFSRPWDQELPRSMRQAIAAAGALETLLRTREYKVVRIDDASGRIHGIRNRD